MSLYEIAEAIEEFRDAGTRLVHVVAERFGELSHLPLSGQGYGAAPEAIVEPGEKADIFAVRSRDDRILDHRRAGADGADPQVAASTVKDLLPLRGIVTVLNTPFTTTNEVDAAALRRHVRVALDAGVATLSAYNPFLVGHVLTAVYSAVGIALLTRRQFSRTRD